MGMAHGVCFLRLYHPSLSFFFPFAFVTYCIPLFSQLLAPTGVIVSASDGKLHALSGT